VKQDLILSFVHAHFRVNMVQDDVSNDDMAQDDIETPPPRPPPPTPPPPPPPPRFTIEEEQTRLYRRLNAQGTQLTVRLLPPPEGEDEDPNPMSHFLDSVTELFEYALRDLMDSDIVGITISSEVEVKNRAIGISFRRDQITGDVIWLVFEKVAQSNARFNALDKLVTTIHSLKMPIGHGGGIATKGRPLETTVHLKRSIVQVKAKSNCLAHTLVIAKAKIDGDPNYESYRHGCKLRPIVDRLLETTGVDLSRGGGVPDLMRFQEYFKEYRIVVFRGLNCADIYFDGKVESEKRINLVYDDVKGHYHVIKS